MANPFLRWAGGKTKLLPELLSRIPSDIETYHEPFVGGGALFFALASESPRRFRNAVLSDANAELITTYKEVRDHVGHVIDILKHSARGYNVVDDQRNYYDAARAMPSIGRSAVVAARMIFLNKTCFNGLYRVNKRGEFNVPWGKRLEYVVDVDGLMAASEALQGVDLIYAPFEPSIAVSNKNDFIYADPPYVPVSATADFASYTANGFGHDDHKRLVRSLRLASDRGARFLYSNSDTPVSRALWSPRGVSIASVQAARAINSKGGGRGKVGEILVRSNRQ